MAQLKDSLITGSLRVTDTIYTSILQASSTINGLTLTPAATGFTITGGTTSKTLTVGADYTLAAACAKEVTDKSSATAISNSDTNLITARSVYYGLPSINNAHNYTSSTTIYAPTDGGTAGQFLKAVGSTSTPTWANTTDITSLGTITTGTWSATAIAANKGGTGQTTYAVGDILYCGTANTLSKLGGNTTTTKKFLTMTGTGSAGATPGWDTLTLTDIPAGIARGNGRVFYGTCDTAAATTDKEVICAAYDKVLTNGDVMIVKFTNTNSGAVGSLTLSIKTSSSDTAGTTAKNIKRLYNTTGASNLNATGELNKDAIAVFIYNGTYWILTNADYNNTYYYTSAYCSTAAATAKKVGTVGYHTAATAGKYFQVMMIHSNTAQSALTFSLGGSGNKPLYINGEVSSASNHTLPSGLYMVYYDGTNFYFRTDNKIDANVIGHDINAQYYAILDNSTPGVEKAHFVWNSTRQSIDFIFN